MKSIGIVRKLDELGRIVIPKEIRNSLNIKNGDSLDIYIDDKKIVLSKYSKLKTFREISSVYLDLLKNISNEDIIITDKNVVLSSINKNYLNKTLSNKVIDLINDRKEIISNNSIDISLFKDEVINTNFILLPILYDGDVLGSVILFKNGNIGKVDDTISRFLLNIIRNELL